MNPAQTPTQTPPNAPALALAHDPRLNVISHPLVKEKLTRLRDHSTGCLDFRRLLGEIALLMAYEVARDFETAPQEVQTPLGRCAGARVKRNIVLVPVLRAGLGMLEPILQIMPDARIGFLGIKRDERSLEPQPYYANIPADLSGSETILIDPMLATGGSALAALEHLQRHKAVHLRFLCLVAAPEGIARVRSSHPDLPIYTAAIDQSLNEKGYIIPGLGDAGDRLFGQ